MSVVFEHLSNREIATIIWIVIAAVGIWLSGKGGFAKSLFLVLKAFAQRKILLVVGLMVLYICAVVGLLYVGGMWDPSATKKTVVWSVAVGFISIMELNRKDRPYKFIIKSMRDTIAATAFVEFLVGMSSFNIVIELILVPITTFLGFAYAFSQGQEKLKAVSRLSSWILFAIVIWFVGDALAQITTNFEKFASIDTLKDLSLPVLLTVLFAPFLAFLAAYTSYENVFVTLHISIKQDRLRSYAKLMSLAAFGFNLELLKRWKTEVMNTRPESRHHVQESFREVRRVWKLERNPPTIQIEDGWSPFKAKDFLCHPEIFADGYHRHAYELDDWSASSASYTLNKGYPSNRISYSIYGNREAVVHLELTLLVEDMDTKEEAIRVFGELAGDLVGSAMGENIPPKLSIELEENEKKKLSINLGKEIILERRDTSLNNYESCELRLTLQNENAKLSWEVRAGE